MKFQGEERTNIEKVIEETAQTIATMNDVVNKREQQTTLLKDAEDCIKTELVKTRETISQLQKRMEQLQTKKNADISKKKMLKHIRQLQNQHSLAQKNLSEQRDLHQHLEEVIKSTELKEKQTVRQEEASMDQIAAVDQVISQSQTQLEEQNGLSSVAGAAASDADLAIRTHLEQVKDLNIERKNLLADVSNIEGRVTQAESAQQAQAEAASTPAEAPAPDSSAEEGAQEEDAEAGAVAEESEGGSFLQQSTLSTSGTNSISMLGSNIAVYDICPLVMLSFVMFSFIVVAMRRRALK